MTSSTSTPQDELDKILWNAIIQAVAGSINAPDDVVDTTDISERCFIEAKIALLDYLDRTVAERVLAARIDTLERLPLARHNCNLRKIVDERLNQLKGGHDPYAELRAAVQTQGESNE